MHIYDHIKGWFALQVNEAGQPIHYMLAAEFGSPFVLAYVASYMLVTMGCLAIVFCGPLGPTLFSFAYVGCTYTGYV